MNCFYLLLILIFSTNGFGKSSIVLRIMTYNVENLFDASHDPGKNDWAYLPTSMKSKAYIKKKCLHIHSPYYRKQCLNQDWTIHHAKQKSANLARVIRSRGVPPDLLVLNEVENTIALDILGSKLPSFTSSILIEGSDRRGIDNAILSSLEKVGKPWIQKLQFPNQKPIATRPFLISTFRKHQKSLAVIALHFPSQRKRKIYRRQAIFQLNTLANKLSQKYDYVIAAGDFNITHKEQNLFSLLRKSWLLSMDHTNGQGTYFYQKKDQWSHFDLILLRKGKTCRFLPEKTQILTNHSSVPARYSLATRMGTSDHFPVISDIICSKE